MARIILIALAKLLGRLTRVFGIGSGLTWPGHLVISFFPDFIEDSVSNISSGIIIVSGTNGKTTTTQALAFLLEKKGYRVVSNASGANLLNGIASALVSICDLRGNFRADFGVFEVDEGLLPQALEVTRPKVLILLNLFRDQLDRYGEVDALITKWSSALKLLPEATRVFINANDPALSFLGEESRLQVVYFGLDDERFSLEKTPGHADSLYCLNCFSPLSYRQLFFSHLGIWFCPQCPARMPQVDFIASQVTRSGEGISFLINNTVVRTGLKGLYNVYNLSAVFAAARSFGFDREEIAVLLGGFTARFGRQEIFKVRRGSAQILLSKNPTGFNENLKLLSDLVKEGDVFLLVLNDGIADGRDVSWIYDVAFEDYPELFDKPFFVSGSRAFDLALRLKYAGITAFLSVSKNLGDGLEASLRCLGEGGRLYILPTYTAMLEVRGFLGGKAALLV